MLCAGQPAWTGLPVEVQPDMQPRNIPSHVWDAFREEITQKYMTEKLPLAKLASSMQTEYGFWATYVLLSTVDHGGS